MKHLVTPSSGQKNKLSVEKEVVQIKGKEFLDCGPEGNNRIKQNDVKNIDSQTNLCQRAE
jgi:hypothetical protein